MQSLVRACQQAPLALKASVAVVIANTPKAKGIEWAKAEGLPVEVFANAEYSREAQEDAIVECLQAHNVDVVCLAGYMRIVSPKLLNAMGGRVLNIHPSLLPRHGGAGLFGSRVHQSVLSSGDTESGCTVHWVTPDVDAGPILVQRRVPVLPEDTADTLSQRVLTEEHGAYPEAIQQVVAAMSGSGLAANTSMPLH